MEPMLERLNHKWAVRPASPWRRKAGKVAETIRPEATGFYTHTRGATWWSCREASRGYFRTRTGQSSDKTRGRPWTVSAQATSAWGDTSVVSSGSPDHKPLKVGPFSAILREIAEDAHLSREKLVRKLFS